MLKTCHPSESELWEEALRALRKPHGTMPNQRLRDHFHRAADLKSAPVPPELSGALSRTNCVYVGPRPAAFEKPRYGTPAYAIALKVGWITAEEEKGDRLAYERRRQRSLRTCHRESLYERPRHAAPRDTGAYVPPLSARLENDRNLTDGARRCARKIAEIAYRQNREGRAIDIKVVYLVKALGRCRRTVQRYLRLLEREGYVRVDVIKSRFSRMCVGLVVKLMGPLFARHHRERWPDRKAPRNGRNPGATNESQNQPNSFSLGYFKEEGSLIPAPFWAERCRDGVKRALMKTNSLAGLPRITAP